MDVKNYLHNPCGWSINKVHSMPPLSIIPIEYIHTYIHTCPTHIPTYIHTYMYMCVRERESPRGRILEVFLDHKNNLHENFNKGNMFFARYEMEGTLW
jgi:hypothetical protein